MDGGWERKDRLKRVKSENRSDETTEEGKEKRGTEEGCFLKPRRAGRRARELAIVSASASLAAAL